jgi:hypothetical protein
MVKIIKTDDNTHAELSKLGSKCQTFNDGTWMQKKRPCLLNDIGKKKRPKCDSLMRLE